MKTVFTNNQVCHVWAQQTQSHGRGSNIFFDGPSIFSYGRHFEMARFINSDVVFVTNRGYSNTTAKHKSLTYRALNHKTVFTVPSFTDHQENLRYLIEQARQTYDKASRARTNGPWLIEQAGNQVQVIENYLKAFPSVTIPADLADLWKVLDSGDYLTSDVRETLIAKEIEANAKRKERERLAREERQRKEDEKLEQWKNGEQVYGWFETTALRINGKIVQTTKGAEVPVIEARKAYRALQAGIDLVGRRIGHFTVSKVTADELVIGCHNIPMSEVHRIGHLLMTQVQAEPAEPVSVHPLDAWMQA